MLFPRISTLLTHRNFSVSCIAPIGCVISGFNSLACRNFYQGRNNGLARAGRFKTKAKGQVTVREKVALEQHGDGPFDLDSWRRQQANRRWYWNEKGASEVHKLYSELKLAIYCSILAYPLSMQPLMGFWTWTQQLRLPVDHWWCGLQGAKHRIWNVFRIQTLKFKAWSRRSFALWRMLELALSLSRAARRGKKRERSLMLTISGSQQ